MGSKSDDLARPFNERDPLDRLRFSIRSHRPHLRSILEHAGDGRRPRASVTRTIGSTSLAAPLRRPYSFHRRRDMVAPMVSAARRSGSASQVRVTRRGLRLGMAE